MRLKLITLFTLFILTIHSAYAQTKTISFNEGWDFVGLEFANKTAIDSLRKLGSNWNDQFLIEQIESSQELEPAPDYKQLTQKLSDKRWKKITIPHIAFPEPLVIVKPREGMAYYKKDFHIPQNQKGKIISIEFEAVMQLTNLWVNGQFMGQFTGGYLPFEVDITNQINYDGENTVLLEVNNRPHPLVPPGKPVEKLDFIYYSGIYRDVWMHFKNPTHITNPITANKVAGGGIFVSYPKVSPREAIVEIQTHIQNIGMVDQPFVLLQQLRNKAGKIIAQTKTDLSRLSSKSDKHFTQQLTVKEPQLWHPDHPNLYQLHSIILNGKTILDERTTRIGIRSFEISKEKGLLINGEQYRVTGTNRHQNYPYIGNALPDNANYRDAWLIRNAGMTGVRSGHYPQDKSFMDAADELGLLIINCIPGWQFFNKNPKFEENVMRDIRNMIRRDRNHPSVLLWEVSLNETYPSADFRCRQAAVAREEWQGRSGFYTSGDTYHVTACWDVPYDDWNGNPGKRDNTSMPHNAYLIREYGDYEFGGGSSTTRKLRGDGQEALLQQAWNLQWSHNKNLRDPRCIGNLNWAFFDGLAGLMVGIEAWGVADIFRIPKFSYHFFKSQQKTDKNKTLPFTTGAYITIANYWTEQPKDNKVIVYSNGDEVALYLNDRLITRQKPDSGPETDYGTELHRGGKPFDGGNANRLAHPPFTFHNIRFAPGTLKAVAYQNGKELASTSVSTPDKAASIQLEIAEAGKPLTKGTDDLVFVYAAIKNAKGNPVSSASLPVSLKIMGDAEIIGTASIKAEAGIASFLIRIPKDSKKLSLKAEAAGLMPAQKTLW